MKPKSSLVIVLASVIAVFVTVEDVRADVLIDIDWESDSVGTRLDEISGWQRLLDGSPGGDNPPIVAQDDPNETLYTPDPNNNFLTTGPADNQPYRFALAFDNPGLNPSSTLTITADVWDPLFNQATETNPSHTFPRMMMGIFQQYGFSTMPSHVGLENAVGDPTTAEWGVGQEPFLGRKYDGVDTVTQNTWYTMRSVWDLGAQTKTLEVKERDSVGGFTTVFASEPIGFLDPNQNMYDLNAFGIRMMRGTRLDNVLVEATGLVPLADADFDRSGTVNSTDLGIWQGGYGKALTPSNATVAYWDMDRFEDFDPDPNTVDRRMRDLEGSGGSGGTGHNLIARPRFPEFVVNPTVYHEFRPLVHPEPPNPDPVAALDPNSSPNPDNILSLNAEWTAYSTDTTVGDYGDFQFDNDASFTFESWMLVLNPPVAGPMTLATNRGSGIGGVNFEGWEINIVDGVDIEVSVRGSGSAADDVTILIEDVIENLETVDPDDPGGSPFLTSLKNHIALVWDHLANGGDGQIDVYLNGDLIGGAAGDPDWSGARGGAFSLGAAETDGDSKWDEQNFIGSIDEVRFSSASLSSDQFLFTGVGRKDGDANGDGVVDGSDFLIWQRQNGTGVALQANANVVPEPATIGMLLMNTALFAGCRPVRRSCSAGELDR